MKEIYLANGKGVALVDDEDYARVSRYSWHLQSEGYAAARINYKIVLMHRVLMGEPPFARAWVDHINGDRLDNRRENLRWVSVTQNHANRRKSERTSSRYKGVSWYARYGKWKARIVIGHEDVHLGYFDDENEAARAYDRAALKYFGEFAKTNFPREIYEEDNSYAE